MSVTQVQTTAITNDAVTVDKIADNAVGTSQIADDAVTNAKIADNAVGTTEISANAVTATQIATGAVGTTEIANAAVTADKMGSGSVSILHAANAGASSITLTLGSGNYFVEFYYTTHLSDGINAIMVIDGTNVQTSAAYSYDGTYYLPMFGAKSDVSGSRTITCSITNGLGFPNAGAQRCMVKATRVY